MSDETPPKCRKEGRRRTRLKERAAKKVAEYNVRKITVLPILLEGAVSAEEQRTCTFTECAIGLLGSVLTPDSLIRDINKNETKTPSVHLGYSDQC